MNIAILSGEISGDLIGGALAQELKRLSPGVELWGLGSAAMREAGVALPADSAEWGVISITQAAAKYPYLRFDVLPKVQKMLRARRPDVVVLIDFGAFNIRVARYATALGLKVLYYFPPGAWRRTGGQGAELAKVTDLLVTPFDWSAERFRALGANVVSVGHPMRERVKAAMTRSEFAAQFGMDADAPIIGLLPGSRHHEIAHLMPTLLQAARLIYAKVPNAQFVVGVAPSLSPEEMVKYLTGHNELKGRLSEIWHEFAQEAETKIWKPVSRTAGALTSQRSRMLVTPGGVLVPEESLQKEMEARRHSEHLRARADQALPPIVLTKGLTYDVMAHSDVLLTCSGTATLEAAIFATPMVILYKLSKVMEVEARLRGLHKKIKFIGLPNILADRTIVPELLQDAATPEAITEHALALLRDIETRRRVREDLKAVAEMLGTSGASERTARLVLELAGSRAE